MSVYSPTYDEEFYPPIQCESGWRCFYCGYTRSEYSQVVDHQYEGFLCDDIWNDRLKNVFDKLAPALYTFVVFNDLMDLFVRNLDLWTAEETSFYTYFMIKLGLYKIPPDIELQAINVNIDDIGDDELSVCMRAVLDVDLLHQNAIFYMKGLLPKVNVDMLSESEEES